MKVFSFLPLEESDAEPAVESPNASLPSSSQEKPAAYAIPLLSVPLFWRLICVS